jgi:hypothetical protein
MTDYGVYETNGITEEGHKFREEIDRSRNIWIDDPELARIERLRLISDPGFPVWDLSYCWGVLKDGTKVTVKLTRSQFGKRTLKAELIEMCKELGVYAKGLGLLEECNISKCQ